MSKKSPFTPALVRLTAAQALFQTFSIMNLTLSGLIGMSLAPDLSLATLPLSLNMVMAGVSLVPVAMVMKRFGARFGFLLGAGFGLLAAILCFMAVSNRDFRLFAIGTALMGVFLASSQYYRFVAADSVAPDQKPRALAWVLGGGVVAALLGPNLARFAAPLGDKPYALCFALMAGLAIMGILVLFSLKDAPAASHEHSGRPLKSIILSAGFLQALALSAISNALMVMIMTATPLAMKQCGLGIGAAAQVIQWHVLGMFLPSFFTGSLMVRFGVKPVVMTGIAIMVAQIFVAVSGQAEWQFVVSLCLLGLGWNLMFIGGSSLLTRVYAPEEREKVQAAHDLLLYVFTASGSLSAGIALKYLSWNGLNLWALPLLLVAVVVVFWRQSAALRIT